MRIQENKSYRTREGTTVSNLKRVENGTAYIFEGYITDPETQKIIEYRSWTKTGVYLAISMEHPLDLVEEINQHYDLFEHYEMQPPKLKEVLDRWNEKFTDELSYEEVAQLLSDVEKVGYTFDYYLDAAPYGLRPIGIELNQLKGWED